MNESNAGLTEDPLFIAAARPPMRWGVTHTALLVEVMVTMEIFLVCKNPLALLLGLPLHGLSVLFCARDPRFFDLAALWMRTRLPALTRNFRRWKGVSYSPLILDLPDSRGVRRRTPVVRV